jgi:hypothetical protein
MSIILNAGQIISIVIGGITTETGNVAAVTSTSADFVANTLTFTVQTGVVTLGVFIPGTTGFSTVQIVINTFTGFWFVNGSAMTGTLVGADLLAVQNNMIALRNQGESFANVNSIVPGTVVPW